MPPTTPRTRRSCRASSSSSTRARHPSRGRSSSRSRFRTRPTSRRSSPTRRGGPVHLLVPQRGERRELMALATRNAGETLAREQARWLADEGKTLAALEQLAAALELPGPPLRIECYDISNVQGSDSVGSMVVFEEGKPRTGEYRRFKIRTVVGANDYASHQEVLRRRFRRARNGEEGSAEELRWAMPDLVIIDGGKGQVAAAKEVLDELGLHDLPLAGIAKEREELFLPGRSVAGRPAADVECPVPRPAAARRGPPLRDHVPPRPALQAPDPLRVRRPAGRRARSAGGRCCGSSAPRSGSARPRSSRSPRCPGSARRWRPASRNRWKPEADLARPSRTPAAPPIARRDRANVPVPHRSRGTTRESSRRSRRGMLVRCARRRRPIRRRSPDQPPGHVRGTSGVANSAIDRAR